jgi:predicted MFS family arabinose efflux permease
VAAGSGLDGVGSTRYVAYVIGLLTVVNVFNYMDRMALAVLLPSIKADLDLSDAQLGLLTGLAFSVFYAICGIPLARWADRGVRRNIIAMVLGVWSVMTALTGIAQHYWQLFAARVGVGAGEAGCLPPAQSILCDCVPLEKRSGAYAIHTFGLYAGMMVGMLLAGWLAETIGWRMTFVVLGIPGVVLALVVRGTLREPVRGFFDNVASEGPGLSLRETLKFLWRCRTYRLLTLFGVTNGFLQYGLNQWWPSFYARIYGLTLATTGTYLGLAIGAGSAVGLLTGVQLPLKIGAWATMLALPVVLMSLFAPSAPVSIALVALTALLWSVSNGASAAATFSIVVPRVRATAASVSIFFTSVLGFGLGPFSVGVLSSVLSPTLGSEGLRVALLLPTCMLPVMVVALLAAAKRLPDDLLAVGRLNGDTSSVHHRDVASDARAKSTPIPRGVVKVRQIDERIQGDV